MITNFLFIFYYFLKFKRTGIYLSDADYFRVCMHNLPCVSNVYDVFHNVTIMCDVCHNVTITCDVCHGNQIPCTRYLNIVFILVLQPLVTRGASRRRSGSNTMASSGSSDHRGNSSPVSLILYFFW